jgi:hypothetical protein
MREVLRERNSLEFRVKSLGLRVFKFAVYYFSKNEY